jgi:hypothetical protein
MKYIDGARNNKYKMCVLVHYCQAHNKLTIFTPRVDSVTLLETPESKLGCWDVECYKTSLRKPRAMFQVSETSFSPPTSWRLLELATQLIRIFALAYWIQVLSCLFHFTCRVLHEVYNQFYISIWSIVQQNPHTSTCNLYEYFAVSKPEDMNLYRLRVHIILISYTFLTP